MKNFMILIVTTLLCSTASAQHKCHIMYDAGSSGTRLYIYEQQDSKWVPHEGPKVGALADPVREIQGNEWEEAANKVVENVVQALDDMKKDFDWSTQCKIASATVFATAGMRLAEQKNRSRSKKLWEILNKQLQDKLQDKLDPSLVTTRTLTGFEEGLYAWLSIREKKKSHYFGIVEMGGASAQVTFPCENCKGARVILVKKEPVRLYSYSFLGLGQDEALKRFGRTPSCAHGAGLVKEDWAIADCANHMPLKSEKGIGDPKNYGSDGQLGTYNDIPTNKADIWEWVLTGAFQFMKKTDIDYFCKNQNVVEYKPAISCFNAVYQRKYLKALGVSSSFKKDDASWTLGAVICKANDCLKEAEKAGKLLCRWSKEGCL